jgi:predicted NBD/HSP70 family sugar kinase
MEFADRAARNEEVFRGVNERIEEGAARHDVETPISFHCECSRSGCVEKISMSLGDYERVSGERYRFALAEGHDDPRIELVVERREGFVVAEKIGEAREQIDRDHPQERHRR